MNRTCTYGAPCLLIAVALVQIYTAKTKYLTPWKGGGFGMFSTWDSVSARYARFFIDDGKSLHPISIRGRTITQLQAMPSPARMRAVIHLNLNHSWGYNIRSRQQKMLLTKGLVGSPLTRVFNEVAFRRLEYKKGDGFDHQIKQKTLIGELWRYRFDGTRNRVQVERMFRMNRRGANNAKTH